MSLNERTPTQRIAEHKAAIHILRGALSRAPLFAQEASRLIEHHSASIVKLQATLAKGSGK